MQAGVGAETFAIDKAEAKRLHPNLKLDGVAAIGYEPNSGYADPTSPRRGSSRPHATWAPRCDRGPQPTLS